MKTIYLRLAVVLVMFTFFLGCSSDSDSDNSQECPQGYTGENCDIQLTPTKIKITKIRVKKFLNSDPATGFSWDWPSNSTDIRLRIDNGSTNLLLSSDYYENVTSTGNDSFDFVLTNPIETTSTSTIYSISILDYDGNDTPSSADDYMQTIYYSPYVDIDGFPTSIMASDLNEDYKIEVFQTYEW